MSYNDFPGSVRRDNQQRSSAARAFVAYRLEVDEVVRREWSCRLCVKGECECIIDALAAAREAGRKSEVFGRCANSGKWILLQSFKWRRVTEES